MERQRAAALGKETLEILEIGAYVSPSGRRIVIGEAVRRSHDRTVSYPPDAILPPVERRGRAETRIDVVNDTTLSVARRLAAEGAVPGVLNFAAATHPGGGFRSGARAQEEGLARSSGLYHCLKDQPMYDFHRERGHRNFLYTRYAIYSPDVPVFRLDDGALLEEPWSCSFVSCAAVQANRVRETGACNEDTITREMDDRIRRVLHIFALHGHRTLLLGAWGCGAFGNSAATVAGAFREALRGEFGHVFAHIVFAITDWSIEKKFIGPFGTAFGVAAR